MTNWLKDKNLLLKEDCKYPDCNILCAWVNGSSIMDQCFGDVNIIERTFPYESTLDSYGNVLSVMLKFLCTESFIARVFWYWHVLTTFGQNCIPISLW